MVDKNMVLTDPITETEVQIPAGSRQQLETLARSLRALYASHNTEVPYTAALSSLKSTPVEDEWYFVAIENINSVRARTNIQFGLNQYSSTQRDTAPRRLSQDQAQGAGKS